ncbi:MAG: hypothetical protein WCI20_00365 [bacterium]
MDITFLLISGGFILEEFKDPEAALEFREYMKAGHPGQSYELVADG